MPAAVTYRDAHPVYRKAGWTGPLPLTDGTKWPPPEGWTGWHGAYPSYADSEAWCDCTDYRDTHQVALRMADGVIGLDVDHYGDKRGADTIAEAERRWGSLPAGPRSSARGEGPAGIRFFRVPPGTVLRTALGFRELGVGAVEVIQRHHRYAVVWPSVHPNGQPYRWYGTAGGDSPPRVAELPTLPDTWIEALSSHGEPGEAEATPEQVVEFSQTHGDGNHSASLNGPLAIFKRDVAAGLARHDAMVNAACMAAREARAGAYPAAEARRALREEFVLALAEAKAGQRLATPVESRREFESVWGWAVGQALALSVEECGARMRRNEPPLPPEPPEDEWPPFEEFYGGPPVDSVDSVDSVDDGEEPVSSWAAVDLVAVWDDNAPRKVAGVLHRTDDAGMFYPGETHSVHGESESGKSWIAQIAAVETLARGERVLYLDYESDAREVLGRLRALGMRRTDLERFDYRAPEGPRDAEFHALLEQRFDLAVVDGVTAAIGLEPEAKSNDGDAVTAWNAALPRRIAKRTGAAVVVIDHVSKGGEGRGRFAIGSQAKMAAVSGSAFYVDVEQALRPNATGVLRLLVGKDRSGSVRERSGPMSRDRLQPFARLVFKSSPAGIDYGLRPWLGEENETDGPAVDDTVWGDPLWWKTVTEIPDRVAALINGRGSRGALDIYRVLAHVDAPSGLTKAEIGRALDELPDAPKRSVRLAGFALLARKGITGEGDTPSRLVLRAEFKPGRNVRIA